MDVPVTLDQLPSGQLEVFRILNSDPAEVFTFEVIPPDGAGVEYYGSNRFGFWAEEGGNFVIVATGSMGTTASLVMEVKNLPSDLVLMERAIVRSIRDVLMTVAHIGPVHTTDRFLEVGEDDVEGTTTPDPVGGASVALTNYVEIGIPTVAPADETGSSRGGDTVCVKFVFVYPLSYTLGVRDSWPNAEEGFPYKSSGEMFIATYLLAMRALARKRTLGFANVWCELLQQENPGTLSNDKGEALSHIADWGLQIEVKRPL
jgi:hypothetical protein